MVFVSKCCNRYLDSRGPFRGLHCWHTLGFLRVGRGAGHIYHSFPFLNMVIDPSLAWPGSRLEYLPFVNIEYDDVLCR